MNDFLREYPAVLDVVEVAEILNITPATVRKLAKKNELPSLKIGRQIRIPKDRLINFLGTNTR